MIAAHLRRFNQSHQWDVPQVLPIGGFLMSAPHLHHSDKILGWRGFREVREFREFREIKDTANIALP